MIFSSKSQMIHVISEVVVLIGFTFYFTSKLTYFSSINKKKLCVSKNTKNERKTHLNEQLEFRTY